MLHTGGACVRVFSAEHLQHTFPPLCALLLREQDPPLVMLHDPPHRHPKFSAEQQAMECFDPVLRGFLPTDSVELLSGGPQRVLHQHLVASCLPRIKAFLNPPSDVPGCRDIAGPLERHRLKDNEAL